MKTYMFEDALIFEASFQGVDDQGREYYADGVSVALPEDEGYVGMLLHAEPTPPDLMEWASQLVAERRTRPNDAPDESSGR